MLKSLRDQPGTQREYETIYILRPETDSDQLKTVNTRLRKVIDEAEGKLIRVENWGKRKLAYEIQKHNKGIYLYWRYLAGSTLVSELERNLRMLDPVLRYLTVKIDEDVDPNARPTGVSEEVFSAAAETRPDEEDYYLGRAGQRGEGEESDGETAAGSSEGEAPQGEQAEAKPAEGEASAEAAPAASEGEAAAEPAAAEPAAAEPAVAEGDQPAQVEEPAAEGEEPAKEEV